MVPKSARAGGHEDTEFDFTNGNKNDHDKGDGGSDNMSSGENPYDYEYPNAADSEDQFASEYDFGLTTAGNEDDDISNPEK